VRNTLNAVIQKDLEFALRRLSNVNAVAAIVRTRAGGGFQDVDIDGVGVSDDNQARSLGRLASLTSEGAPHSWAGSHLTHTSAPPIASIW
jgi:hypothetical protein